MCVGSNRQWLRSACDLGFDRSHAAESLGNTLYTGGSRDFMSFSTSSGWITARDTNGPLLWETLVDDGVAPQHVEIHDLATDGAELYALGIRGTQAMGPFKDDLIVLRFDAAGTLLQEIQERGLGGRLAHTVP